MRCRKRQDRECLRWIWEMECSLWDGLFVINTLLKKRKHKK